jgi:pantoate--beta-alanine ligase
MRLVTTIDELNRAVGASKPVFVPTMGALHAGHQALIHRAGKLSRNYQPVLVSIFVNPTQFGPGEDYARYPRSLDADLKASAAAGADIVFNPAVETIYPQGMDIAKAQDTFLSGPLPAVATEPKLEDAYRPTHFAGVCQVVARLFDLVRPSVAVFGEKDYQQLLVIKAIVAQEGDRWAGLRIEAHPTLRESGGLAMSSRNAYLTDQQRENALGLNRALDAANIVRLEDAEREMAEILEHHDLKVDYAVIRDAQTLLAPRSRQGPLRALIAARVGNVRLIDNMAIDIVS